MSQEQLLSPRACFIFDLDGTLMDFVAVFNEMCRRVWAEFHIEFTNDRLQQLGVYARSQVKGQSNAWFFVKLLWKSAKKMGIPWHKRFAFLKSSGQVFKALIPEITLLPGIPEVLAELRHQHFPIALQTSASAAEIQSHMVKYPDFLQTYIDLPLGRDDVKKMKPAPDGIFLVANHFHVPPTRCIFVGDMEVDMQAARAAGAVGVGVLTGFDDSQLLKAAGADFVLESVASIPRILPEIMAILDQRSEKKGH